MGNRLIKNEATRNLSVSFHRALSLGLCFLFLTAVSYTSSAEQRLLLKNAAMVITMDTSLGEGELGIIANADVLRWRTGIGRLAPYFFSMLPSGSIGTVKQNIFTAKMTPQIEMCRSGRAICP